MRITFVLPFLPRSPVGGPRVVYEHANQLVARGHEVVVVHPRVESGLRHRVRHPLVVARKLAKAAITLGQPAEVTWMRVDPRVQLALTTGLGASSIPTGDVVVATAWHTVERVVALPRDRGRGLHLVQHDEVWDGPVHLVEAAMRAPIAKVAISRWLVRRLVELGVPADAVRHVPNGVDRATFRVITPPDDRPLRVAMLCHRQPWKGARDGVAALEHARTRHPELRAVLFGTDARPRWLPAWIDYERDPPVETLVRDVYNASRVYLCPSWSEGWHLPSIEALACGSALVTTAIEAAEDYATDGVDAVIAPVRDPATLGLRLAELLADEPRRLRLARAGHERVAQFTWERAGDRFEAWLTELVAAGG